MNILKHNLYNQYVKEIENILKKLKKDYTKQNIFYIIKKSKEERKFDMKVYKKYRKKYFKKRLYKIRKNLNNKKVEKRKIDK